MSQSSLGLSRRELEYELRWMLRRLPDDRDELVKLLTSAMVTLIEKNNAAIAAQLAADDADDGGDF